MHLLISKILMHLQKVHKLSRILIFRDFNLLSGCFEIMGLGYTITLILDNHIV